MNALDQHPWLSKAACSGLPASMFFEDISPVDASGDETGEFRDHAYEKAKAICSGCPVRLSCHIAAMVDEAGAASNRRFGIRGGITPGQRYSLWRRDAVSCETCGEVYDPLGIVAGDAVCSCGEFQEAPIEPQGDLWFPRHDGLLRRLIDYLLQNTEPGDRILPPYKMLLALGHRRKDDLPLCYLRLIDDGMIVKGPGRGEYYRAAGRAALSTWVPPIHRHRSRIALVPDAPEQAAA